MPESFNMFDRKAYGKKFHKENPEYLKNWYKEHREKEIKYSLNYYYTHKKDRNEKMRKWYQENKESHLNRMTEYFKTPKGKKVRKAAVHNRRCESELTTETVQRVYENNIKKFGTLICELCFKPIKFKDDSLDHLTPICRGEEFPDIDLNSLENLGVAHLDCNRSKNRRTLKEWFELNPELLIK